MAHQNHHGVRPSAGNCQPFNQQCLLDYEPVTAAPKERSNASDQIPKGGVNAARSFISSARRPGSHTVHQM
ncbi:hypothetical protein H9Q74_006441 [Fusarium xylarioides]|nr:hypothetical protein H9Q74_006441 [Fusarium xylarioides]